MALTLGSVPTFSDVSEDLLVVAQPLRQSSIQGISHNAKLGAVRPEVIYEGFFKNGDTIPVSTSPVDGYVYLRQEITYRAMLYHTRAHGGGFTSGQKNPPVAAASGGGAGNLYWWAHKVEDVTGVVDISISYFVEGGAETITHDGIVKVYAVCQRGSDNTFVGTSGKASAGGSGTGLAASGRGGPVSAPPTTYTISMADYHQILTYATATAVAIALPDSGAFPADFWFAVSNDGPASVTITVATELVDGNPTLVIAAGDGFYIYRFAGGYTT